jgi:hypothetical protein
MPNGQWRMAEWGTQIANRKWQRRKAASEQLSFQPVRLDLRDKG